MKINPAWKTIQREIQYYRDLLNLATEMRQDKIASLEGRLKALEQEQTSYQIKIEQKIRELLKQQDEIPKPKIRIIKPTSPLKKKTYTLPKEQE